MEIKDIYCSISDYEYDGSIPLTCCETIIQLKSNLFISIPTVYSNTISISECVKEDMNSIYDIEEKLFSNLIKFHFFNSNQ